METVNDEITRLESELKEKNQEIKIIENKIQNLRDKEELPDYVGKYLYSKNDITSTYMKVDSITKSDLGIYVSGLYISVVLQLMRTTYTVTNYGHMSISNCEIITEDKFNNVLNDAIKSFKH